MNKKSYIQPCLKAFPIIQSEIICGSGGNSESLPKGSATPPIPSANGVITSESKGIFVDEDDCDVEW